MKGILCIKFDLFKIKNTDFWAAYEFIDIHDTICSSFTLSLQKININTFTVEREEESLTESFNNSQTKFKTK